MILFGVMMTRRDLSEGMCYLGDDYQDAWSIGRLVLNSSPESYLRAWLKRVQVSQKQAEAFWATQGDLDGPKTIPCPHVPKRFSAIYYAHYNAARPASP